MKHSLLRLDCGQSNREQHHRRHGLAVNPSLHRDSTDALPCGQSWCEVCIILSARPSLQRVDDALPHTEGGAPQSRTSPRSLAIIIAGSVTNDGFEVVRVTDHLRSCLKSVLRLLACALLFGSLQKRKECARPCHDHHEFTAVHAGVCVILGLCRLLGGLLVPRRCRKEIPVM